MREFDKLANEKFNGNTKETIHYLLFNNDGLKYSDYSDELTEKEQTIAFKYLALSMQKSVGGKKPFSKLILRSRKLESLKMTEDEVLSAQENPFSKKVKINLLILISIIVLPLILARILKNLNISYEAIYYCQAVLIGIYAIDLSGTLTSFFKFSKLKKELETPIPEVSEEEIIVPLDAVTDEEIDAIEIDEKEITRLSLIRELQNIYKDKRSNGYAFLVLSLIFIFCSFISILWIIPTLIWIIFSSIFLGKALLALKQIESLDFKIVKDECISKEDKSENDSWVSNHFLYFKKYGKHKIYDNGKLLYKDWTSSTFRNTSIGDKFYLVLIGKKNHITLVFPEKDWKFISDEFYIDNDVIYPKKDKTSAEILSEKLKEQQKTYSEVSLENVQKAKNLSKKYSKKIISYLLFTLWGAVVCFIASGISYFASNIFISILLSLALIALYTWQTMSTYKACIQTKNALFQLPEHYVEYRKLNGNNDLKLIPLFLLSAINLLSIIFGVLLCITMTFKG